MEQRPGLTRKASSDEVVQVGEGGVHINHMAAHQHVSVDGNMGTHHSFAAEEAAAFSNLINGQLENDLVAKHMLPLNPTSDDIFKKQTDGLILARLINVAQPGTIDEKKLNKHVDGREMSVFQRNENLNVVVAAAKTIGCHIVNIGAQDISEGHPIPILGLIWQIFRIGVVANISLDGHPELVLLVEPGETLASLAKLSPEQLLIRWVKYNLGRAGELFKIGSFNDFGNPEVFLALLCQLNPSISRVIGSNEAALDIAQRVIDAANLIGVKTFLSALDLLAGNPRLALGFVAQIFNAVGMESDLEVNVFAAYVNYRLRDSSVVKHLLPLNVTSNDLYVRQYDGLILAELLRDYRVSALDINTLATGGDLSEEAKLNNINTVFAAATACGASFDGIVAQDMISGGPKKILAALWQIIKLRLLANVSLAAHPELAQIAKDADEAAALANSSPDDLLLKWISNHVSNAGGAPVNNFEEDLKDPAVFDKLLDQLLAIADAQGDKDKSSSAAPDAAAADAGDSIGVATNVLDKAKKLGVDTQLLPVDLISLNPRVAELFAAQVFDASTGLAVPVSAETSAFTAYVNSALEGNSNVACCVPIALTSNDLYTVIGNGKVLAELLNEAKAGAVDSSAFGANRTRDEKIAGIEAIIGTIRAAFGSQFITVDINAAEVVDASASSPTHALELLLVIIKIRLVAYLTSVNLTVVRAIISSEASSSAVAPEQVLLGWLQKHLSSTKSGVIINPNATPKF